MVYGAPRLEFKPPLAVLLGRIERISHDADLDFLLRCHDVHPVGVVRRIRRVDLQLVGRIIHIS